MATLCIFNALRWLLFEGRDFDLELKFSHQYGGPASSRLSTCTKFVQLFAMSSCWCQLFTLALHSFQKGMCKLSAKRTWIFSFKTGRKFKACAVVHVHHTPWEVTVAIVAFQKQIFSMEVHEKGSALAPLAAIHAGMNVLKMATLWNSLKGIGIPHQRSAWIFAHEWNSSCDACFYNPSGESIQLVGCLNF